MSSVFTGFGFLDIEKYPTISPFSQAKTLSSRKSTMRPHAS
jgi:hypothetical protein